MQFSTKTLVSQKLKTDLLLLPIGKSNQVEGLNANLDPSLATQIQTALKSADLQNKVGSTLLVPTTGSVKRVLLVRSDDNLSSKAFNDLLRACLRVALATAARDCVSWLGGQQVNGKDGVKSVGWKTRAHILAARELKYRTDQWKGNPEIDNSALQSLCIHADSEVIKASQNGLNEGLAMADGIDLAKDLGNAPGNVCTPTYLADTAKRLGKTVTKPGNKGVKVQIFNEKQIAALGMGSFLAVAQGSHEPPRMIVLEYRGGSAKQAPVALVGKGITFDTGGISLKPGAEMDEMKYDMCGAASVLGTFAAVAQLQLPINLVGVVVATENMPGGSAVKPGDIVKSMSGQTIEILNTDAEGRLILCDALTYVARFKPSTVIDIATLTGACVIALGAQHSGLFTANSALSQNLVKAGLETGDTCWPMPLDDEYHEGLKSNFADMANIGGRAGGAITAACFLAKFAKGYDWAHLDIAGTAWKSGAAKGGTGRPVPLLTQYLIDRSLA